MTLAKPFTLNNYNLWKLKRLTQLEKISIGFKSEWHEKIPDSFFEFLKNVPHIYLNLNDSTSSIPYGFLDLPSLKEIELSSISDTNPSLITALRLCAYAEKLILDNCHFQNGSKWLTELTRLKEVTIVSRKADATFLEPLLQYLCQNSAITTINLTLHADLILRVGNLCTENPKIKLCIATPNSGTTFQKIKQNYPALQFTVE